MGKYFVAVDGNWIFLIPFHISCMHLKLIHNTSCIISPTEAGPVQGFRKVYYQSQTPSNLVFAWF